MADSPSKKSSTRAAWDGLARTQQLPRRTGRPEIPATANPLCRRRRPLLRRETTRSRKLSHPNIIRIHDLDQHEGEDPFIALEYVDGPTLHAFHFTLPKRYLPPDASASVPLTESNRTFTAIQTSDLVVLPPLRQSTYIRTYVRRLSVGI